MGFQDLLDNHTPLMVDAVNGVINPKTIELHEVSDLFPVLDTVRSKRTTIATKMNTKTASHEGSSRSHASLILKLH
jgi:hypothetical protein